MSNNGVMRSTKTAGESDVLISLKGVRVPSDKVVNRGREKKKLKRYTRVSQRLPVGWSSTVTPLAELTTNVAEDLWLDVIA